MLTRKRWARAVGIEIVRIEAQQFEPENVLAHAPLACCQTRAVGALLLQRRRARGIGLAGAQVRAASLLRRAAPATLGAWEGWVAVAAAALLMVRVDALVFAGLQRVTRVCAAANATVARVREVA